MAARSLDLLVNVQAGTIISAFDSTVQGNIPGFVFGDSTPVSVRLVEPSGVQARPWKEIDLTGQSVRIGIGIPGASPTAGTYTLTYGGDTTAALAYNATATQIAAALNALPSITSAGGITITSTANAFKVIFESNGARTALTADTGSLSPTSGAYISTVLEGANDAAAIYLVKLEAMPAAYEELADNLPTAAINVATVREGAVGVSEIQTLSLDPLPYDGTYTLSVAGQETSSLSYDAAATDIQSALELLSGIGTGNVTVSGEFPAFSITFAASRGNVGTMVGNASALTVPTGRRGVLSNNTTGIAELLASRARVDAMLEIEITDNISGETWTPLQVQCVVREDVIPASPASQTPMPVFLTEFMVVNRFLSFDAAQTLSPTQKTQAAENLGLGTAATVDTGTAEGEIPLLGVGGKLASSLLPSLSLTDIIAVADQAARLALVSGEAYGKIVKQADNGRSYALPTGAAAATAGNWIELGDAAITAADIQDATSAGRDLLTAVNAAAQVALLGAETPAGAQAKADAAAAASVSLLGTQIISGAKTFSAEISSLAPLSGSPDQVPSIKQVRQQNRETAAPLVRWNFNSASGSTVKSVSSSVHDGTINGTTKSFVEGSPGYSRQLLLTSADAHVIAPTKEWFNRIHQGLPTTLVLEGESLVVSGISPKAILATGTPAGPATGFYLYQEINLLIVLVVISPNITSGLFVNVSGTLVKIVLTSNGSTVTITATNSVGTVFSGTNTITTFSAGDSTYLPRIGQFGDGVLGGHGMKISSLELYDRVIDI